MSDADTFRNLFEEVRANRARIRSCDKHHFDKAVDGRNILGRVICSKCQGTLSLNDAIHYARGYAAAGGNPDDVLPLPLPKERVNGSKD